MTSDLTLDKVLNKALNEGVLNFQEIELLLSLENDKLINRVFTVARKIRNRYFDNKIFLYGFVYFSTYCRNECIFCYYRNSNDKSPRYRKTTEEILQISKALANSGVHLLDLTMGEDPAIYNKSNFKKLIEIVKVVKEAVDLPIMISPGVSNQKVLLELIECGVDWYACYQETHNEKLFKNLRVNQSYERRMKIRKRAKEEGILVEDGVLLGVREGLKDRVNSILMMRKQGVHQGRVMSFVSQEGTPLENKDTPSRDKELLFIAVMRLVLRDKLIPASLDVDGIQGLKSRLMAGANVVTSIIPPSTGLAGVSNSTLDIEEGYRTVQGVKKVLKDLNLKVASQLDYKKWIAEQKSL